MSGLVFLIFLQQGFNRCWTLTLFPTSQDRFAFIFRTTIMGCLKNKTHNKCKIKVHYLLYKQETRKGMPSSKHTYLDVWTTVNRALVLAIWTETAILLDTLNDPIAVDKLSNYKVYFF